MRERKNNRELHSWVEERLSAYMDNQLPPLERVKVERHLRECSQCERALSSLLWTVSLLKQAPAPALPRSFVLPVPKQTPRAPIISISLLRLATAMATLFLITLVGIDVILQLGGAAAPASLSAPRVAIAPTTVAGQRQAAQSEPPTQAANAQTFSEGRAGATAAPTTAPVAKETVSPTAVPPVVAPLPAAPATAAPPAVAPKPTSPPAATSAPAATAAPAAGALQSQTGAASRPSVRSSAVQGSPTPSAPLVMGRGGGNEKSSQDNAATAAPLQSQPRSLDVEPTDTLVPATETPSSPLPAPKAASAPPTATPRQEALAQPTRALTTQPATVPSSEDAIPVSPLRIAELGALFLAVFLGVLTLLLRR